MKNFYKYLICLALLLSLPVVKIGAEEANEEKPVVETTETPSTPAANDAVAPLAEPAPAADVQPAATKIVFYKDGKKIDEIDLNDGSATIGGNDNRKAPWDEDIKLFGIKIGKKYFIGWSDTKDYSTTKEAKFFYSNEALAGLKNITELHAIYLSTSEANSYINKDNEVVINEAETAKTTLPDSKILEDTFSNTEGDRTVTVAYDKNKNNYEVKLNSDFHMNKVLTHWLYSGNGHTIMTNTQTDKGSSNVDAKYTHVDLLVNFDENIDIPTELNLSFNSYTFQPYMIIDGKTDAREKLEISEVTGSDKWDISELVKTDNPITTFTVKNPNKSNKLILRTILRTNSYFGGKRIPDISAATIESSNMKWISNTNVSILKDRAKTLAETSGTAVIDGVISGLVVLPRPYEKTMIKEVKSKDKIIISFREEPTPAPTPDININYSEQPKTLPKTGVR